LADTPAPVPPPRIDAAALARQQRRLATSAAPWLHEEIARRMAERLDILKLQPSRVIDWWSQAGAGSTLLQTHYPRADHLAIEPAVLLAARDAMSAAPWWRQIGKLLPGRPGRSVATDTQAPAPGQLLWSNMMLHWCADLRSLLARWHGALEVEGMLMFSCFGPDTLASLRRVYRGQGWGEAASGFIDMHDLGDALIGAGFMDPVMDMELLTLTWDSPQALITELHTLGGNTAPQRFGGLRTPRWRDQLDSTLTEQLRGPDGRLRLEIEIVYGHAVRGVTRAPVKANTEISLQTMREMTRKRSGGATP
jgi:malonyl-CoA O-methyltransferase